MSDAPTAATTTVTVPTTSILAATATTVATANATAAATANISAVNTNIDIYKIVGPDLLWLTNASLLSLKKYLFYKNIYALPTYFAIKYQNIGLLVRAK